MKTETETLFELSVNGLKETRAQPGIKIKKKRKPKRIIHLLIKNKNYAHV